MLWVLPGCPGHHGTQASVCPCGASWALQCSVLAIARTSMPGAPLLETPPSNTYIGLMALLPASPAFGRWREEDQAFEMSLGYVRSHLNP